MNYNDARNYITDAGKYGSVLGLGSITELMNRLGNPQDTQRYVHIAGTNGKGSTITYIDAILRRAGYKIGRYMTPAVFEYREEFCIDGRMISEESYARIMTEVSLVADDMERDGLPHPTSFEMETALAFVYFAENNCDLVLLETGMGGETDATNIVKNTLCSVITTISLDHMKFLGNTIEDIAKVKAGIIKRDSTVVVSNQDESVIEVIKKKAVEMNSEFYIATPYIERRLSMTGSYQQNNSVTAEQVVTVLISKGFRGIIRDTVDCIEEGLTEAFLPGRFETISTNPLIIIDGAHNPGAVSRLIDSINDKFTNKKVTFIMGVLADKDYSTEAKMIFARDSKVITVTTSGIRGLSAEKLAETLGQYCDNVVASNSLEEAVKLAKEDVTNGNADMVIAFGSLSYLGELKRIVVGEHNENR
ncbi:MAG: bifunctional folylpolyglutamate synthase/dihydrofolate synthase [Lachnospiraceae bacterium]|nr:bifunctional folylpolyglutamate synthase/dihydrofolate synthase [Lachnospiraceae bacterium]